MTDQNWFKTEDKTTKHVTHECLVLRQGLMEFFEFVFDAKENRSELNANG